MSDVKYEHGEPLEDPRYAQLDNRKGISRFHFVCSARKKCKCMLYSLGNSSHFYSGFD